MLCKLHASLDVIEQKASTYTKLASRGLCVYVKKVRIRAGMPCRKEHT